MGLCVCAPNTPEVSVRLDPFLRPAVRFLQFPLLRLLPSSPPCSHSLVKFYTVSVFLLYLLSWSYCHQNLNGLTSITCFHSVSQNLTGATLQQPLSLWFFDLLRTQNAPSESKLFSPISLLKHCCFSVDFPFFCLFFSFFYKWMYILLVVLHFNLICWLLSIVHELRAELKVDTQNVVRGLYSDRWAKPWTYQVTLWLMSDMLGWGYEARPCDTYQPIFWWCDICRSIVGQCMFLSLFLVLLLGFETWEAAFGNIMERVIYQWHVAFR